MVSNLCIIHRRKPSLFPSQEKLVWSTCLRSLAFRTDARDVQQSDEVHTGAGAYRFLLEILCGLHSPIVGETEVFGQFKIFVGEWLRQRPEHAPIARKLLTDVKLLRSRHLKGMGHQSYGSWLRKHVVEQEVHILGGGHLAREILPYLTKQNKNVTLHVRDPRKIDFHEVRALRDQAFSYGALIVAAPMTAAEISTWLNGKRPDQVFDLRDQSAQDPLAIEHEGLQTIFRQIECNRARLEPVIARVREEIAQLATKAGQTTLLRPQGWDDLCA